LQLSSLRMKASLKIIAVGNPGSGKSTILNSLAGEVLFKAGVNIGQGLTFQLDEAENKNGHLLDTPG
jgi:ribosome biogenesis GTPase A